MEPQGICPRARQLQFAVLKTPILTTLSPFAIVAVPIQEMRIVEHLDDHTLAILHRDTGRIRSKSKTALKREASAVGLGETG